MGFGPPRQENFEGNEGEHTYGVLSALKKRDKDGGPSAERVALEWQWNENF